MPVNKSLFTIPVHGGSLTCARWETTGAPIAIALHGITASHMAWDHLASHLGESFDLIAPDLRGRGGSLTLPPPYGLSAHAEDIISLADSLESEQPMIIGHSLGAYIAVEFAARYPDRASRLVLIDGGIGLPAPAGVESQVFLQQALGPALARLRLTFPSRNAYYEFWQQHPALKEDWSDYTERYLDYDLSGEPPKLTPRISEEAVLVDGEGPISAEMQTRIDCVKAPMLLVTATRGILNEQTPLLPESLVKSTAKRIPALQLQTIEDTNHYSVLMGRGVSRLARNILSFCA